MTPPQNNALFELEYFFELSPDLLCIAGYDGYFKKINPAVSKTLGYSEEELFASPINSFVHPEDQEKTAIRRKSIHEDHPLLNFENRYITKSGEVVWLLWTSMPIKRDQLVFAIAKIIVYKKKLEEYWSISNLLDGKGRASNISSLINEKRYELKPIDQILIDDFEVTVKKYLGKIELNNTLLSDELAISERQLFRRIKNILGITPNKFVRIIRFKLASEAIATGKYSTLSEISNIAGFSTPAYFNKLFKEMYRLNVSELLNKNTQGGISS